MGAVGAALRNSLRLALIILLPLLGWPSAFFAVLAHAVAAIIGALSEADAIVQDAGLRWTARLESGGVPAAYLTRIVTRLCLHQHKFARVRRETHIGT